MDAIEQPLTITIGRVTASGIGSVTVRSGDKVLHQDRLNVLSKAKRSEFIDGLAKLLPAISSDPRHELEEGFTAEAARISLDGGNGQEGGSVDRPTSPDPDELLAAMPAEIRDQAEAMLASPKLVQIIVDDVAALGVAGETELTGSVYLIGTSRLLARPLAGIVQGPSSSGKSFAIDKTASLFPPETVIHATTMTAQALYHLPPGALVHVFVVAGERSRVETDDSAERTRALREMLASGRLTKLVPERDAGNRIVTRLITQDGPISYVESTTLSKVFEEDANRCLLLQTDERANQTRRILKVAARGYSGKSKMDPGTRAAIVNRHHALQRMLKSVPVQIPFADRLAELLPADRVEARRVIGQVLSMIEAITLLHQRQRQADGNGWLIATDEDYAIARRLLRIPVARALGGRISDAAIRFFHARIAALSRDDFDTRLVCNGTQVESRTVRGYLQELHDSGCVELLEPHRGPKPARWRRTGTEPDEADNCGLPPVEQLVDRSCAPAFRQDVSVFH